MSDAPDPGGSPYEPPHTDAQFQEPKPGGPPSQEECNSAMLAHMLGAFLGIIGPLIIFMTKKDGDVFVEDQAKEAVNFQLTMLIGYFASGLLTIVCIGYLMLPAVYITSLVLGIVAAMAANKGEYYRYPLTIRMIT